MRFQVLTILLLQVELFSQLLLELVYGNLTAVSCNIVQRCPPERDGQVDGCQRSDDTLGLADGEAVQGINLHGSSHNMSCHVMKT